MRLSRADNTETVAASHTTTHHVRIARQSLVAQMCGLNRACAPPPLLRGSNRQAPGTRLACARGRTGRSTRLRTHRSARCATRHTLLRQQSTVQGRAVRTSKTRSVMRRNERRRSPRADKCSGGVLRSLAPHRNLADKRLLQADAVRKVAAVLSTAPRLHRFACRHAAAQRAASDALLLHAQRRPGTLRRAARNSRVSTVDCHAVCALRTHRRVAQRAAAGGALADQAAADAHSAVRRGRAQALVERATARFQASIGRLDAVALRNIVCRARG